MRSGSGLSLSSRHGDRLNGQLTSRRLSSRWLAAACGALAILSTGCGGGAKGDAAAGKAVFKSAGCGACHAFKAAGTVGMIGPDLDVQLADENGTLDDHVRESIVEPNAQVAEGYQAGIMPSFGSLLSEKQVDDLVAFIAANV
jgi:mono/diheme cytochrome c family protein